MYPIYHLICMEVPGWKLGDEIGDIAQNQEVPMKNIWKKLSV